MFVDTCLQIKNNLAGTQNLIKMSFVMPFSFNAVKLYVMAINKNLGHVPEKSAENLNMAKPPRPLIL